MTIRQATINDLNQLSILFAQYRVFYEQPFELPISKRKTEQGRKHCLYCY